MAKFNSFEEIISWQKARELNKDIYNLIIENKYFNNDFGLRDQIRRSSISISSNIAEGFEGRPLKSSFAFYILLKLPQESFARNYI
ncbi:hypothetical protein CJ739_1239 [Mariniflexile rhizosphaerae]|nr:hypothetical protein CJ739_1239 [Mariniflexile sp. TRM1-10]PLB20651.1 MAG: S23 ribosomal protein [Flavobacteriaceae bacterium FS1-H7996/R]